MEPHRVSVEPQRKRRRLAMAPKRNKVKNQTKTQKTKRKMFAYSQDGLRRALIQIQENGMGIREASREFAVPKTTLQDRLKGKVPEIPMKTGPPPRLTVAGENEIVQWLINIAKCGFPIRKIDLISTVQKILKDCGKETLFKDGKPGQKWYLNFLRRHPEISLREAETITKARALITEESIRLWFRNLRMYLTQNNCIDILDDPSRILNGDESGFPLCPKTGKVLGPRGYKNLYKIKTGSDKENVTVLVQGSHQQNETKFPDFSRPPKAIVENMPPSWVLGKSESGWMRSDVFFEYIANDFNKWVDENKLKRPILLLVDGHRSHMSLPFSQFCDANKIILYALPPNTTHMLQPADVSVFRPLKQQWKNTVAQWQSEPENLNRSITKVNFCPVFNEALKSSDMTISIKNGFKRCGLFPFDPNNVDYTKCVKNTLEEQHALNSTRIAENEVIITDADFRAAEKIIKKIESNLETYGINTEVILNEIKFLEDEMRQSNVSFGTFVADAEQAASSISVDPIMDISVTEDVLIDEPEIPPLMQILTPEIVVGEEKTLTDSADQLVNLIEGASTNELEKQSPVFVLIESNISSKTEEPAKNSIVYMAEGVETIEYQGHSSLDSILDKPNPSAKILSVEADPVVHVTEDVRTNQHERQASPARTDSSRKTTVVEETSVTNDLVQPIEETASCSNVENNKREPLLSLQGAFKQHLVFPVALDKKKEVKEKLPSAISGEAWREYFAKKENDANHKLNEKKKRKEERGLKKQNKKLKTGKVRKNVGKKQVPNKPTKKKIKCSLCDDELVSDAEEEGERNIGCDFCQRWYHLHCTELNDLPYSVVATMDYKCNFC
ncbi:unnamed protein product [Brassicogethes aeneus]|uniref:Uncharacterized protein n=1 Tax=Brassicogethes aeneus TaxID=1431903 RepID=A0A9P0AUH6_BRAAE|nr:unnamed protein product [Brassicogethes aeneus]